MTEKITGRDARQGRRGTKVLTVLIVGLALAVAAWLFVEALYG